MPQKEFASGTSSAPRAVPKEFRGKFDAFAASFDDTGEKTLQDEYRGSQSQYWITVHDGEVIAIDELYLP
jgi:hypothetical protein